MSNLQLSETPCSGHLPKVPSLKSVVVVVAVVLVLMLVVVVVVVVVVDPSQPDWKAFCYSTMRRNENRHF